MYGVLVLCRYITCRLNKGMAPMRIVMYVWLQNNTYTCNFELKNHNLNVERGHSDASRDSKKEREKDVQTDRINGHQLHYPFVYGVLFHPPYMLLFRQTSPSLD